MNDAPGNPADEQPEIFAHLIAFARFGTLPTPTPCSVPFSDEHQALKLGDRAYRLTAVRVRDLRPVGGHELSLDFRRVLTETGTLGLGFTAVFDQNTTLPAFFHHLGQLTALRR